jgi:hypothetical protein
MVVSKTSMKIAGPRGMGWNSGIELLIDRVKIHVDHPFAAVVGVANQPLSPGINHEIEHFERYEPDQDCAEPSPPWTGAGALTRATMRTARSIQALLNPVVHNLIRQ